MNSIKFFTRICTFGLVIVSLTACASRQVVRESASFTLTQLTVLQANVDSHFDKASKSIKDQKLILQNQFGVNLRLENATTTIMSLASSGDKETSTLYEELKKTAGEMEASDVETLKARNELEAQVETIVSASAPGAAAFDAVSSPLDGLSREKTDKEQLKFWTAYWKSVWAESDALIKAQEETIVQKNTEGTEDSSE